MVTNQGLWRPVKARVRIARLEDEVERALGGMQRGRGVAHTLGCSSGD